MDNNEPYENIDLYMVEIEQGFSLLSLESGTEDVIVNGDEGATHIEWYWAESEDDLKDMVNSSFYLFDQKEAKYSYRKANEYEISAYFEGRLDGHDSAMVKANKENFNGILYEMGGLGDPENGIKVTKGFNCGRCKIWKQYDQAVQLGDMYLSIIPENYPDVLWHVCKDCT